MSIAFLTVPALGQPTPQAETIELIRHPETDSLVYLFPVSAAAHYRTLFLLTEELQALVDSLNKDLATYDHLAATLQEENQLLTQDVADLTAQRSTYEADLNATQALLEQEKKARIRERRKKKFWQVVSTISTTGVGVLALLVAVAR